MSATLTSSLEALDAVLFETGLLMQQIAQGSVKSAAAVEQVCALVASDVQQRVREIAKQSPSATALRRIRERRASLGALEFVVRRASFEMNATLGQLLPAQSPGVYSPESPRLSAAGAWMNMRSSP